MENSQKIIQFWLNEYKFIIPTALALFSLLWNYYQQLRLEYLKRENQKLLTVHKTQFEKEFITYSKIWDALILFKEKNVSLNNKIRYLEYKPDSGIKKDDLEPQLSELSIAGRELKKLLDKSTPFVPDSIYSQLQDLRKLIKKVFDNNSLIAKDQSKILNQWVEFGKISDPDKMLKLMRSEINSLEEVNNKMEEVSNAIRERIYIENSGKTYFLSRIITFLSQINNPKKNRKKQKASPF